MKKNYIIPAIKTKEIKQVILAGSGGVGNGGNLGNTYNEDDASYSKRDFIGFINYE